MTTELYCIAYFPFSSAQSQAIKSATHCDGQQFHHHGIPSLCSIPKRSSEMTNDQNTGSSTRDIQITNCKILIARASIQPAPPNDPDTRTVDSDRSIPDPCNGVMGVMNCEPAA